MAEAEILTLPQRNLSERAKTFINAELIHILATLLFLLLAIFLLYPILGQLEPAVSQEQ